MVSSLVRFLFTCREESQTNEQVLERVSHLARLRRRRAYAPTSNTASHDNLLSYMGMGLRHEVNLHFSGLTLKCSHYSKNKVVKAFSF